jgi:ketosteroid isomerase-like protein
MSPVGNPLQAAKIFMEALDASDAERAASVCAPDVTIVLPGGETELQGITGAKRLIRMAPPFIRRIREEEVDGDTVILRGLTRSPGHFANFTTWTFHTDGERITHISFAWRPAN